VKAGIKAGLAVAALVLLMQASCGEPDNPEGRAAGQGTGLIGAVDAINDIATPPVPNGVIHDARDAAASANAHVEAVDSILEAR